LKARKIPQRMCVGCQEMKNKKELTRIVRTPESEIVIDITGKKPGRGAYICKDEACLTKATKEKRLERALKNPVSPEVYEQLKSELMK
jgi:uncharacterized protein